MPTDTSTRRPLKTRSWPFFQRIAAGFARDGVSPDAISFSSIIFGLAAGGMLAATSRLDGWGLRAAALAAALFIQFRLIANLLDGMVAIEGGKGGPTGDLWNEAPDRVADAAILIGAGYGAGASPILGFAAALVAVFVAYVRALGASVGAGQVFLGPMAKPHRMFAMTVTCLLLAIFLPTPAAIASRSGALFRLNNGGQSMSWEVNLLNCALMIVIVGGVITAIRRLRRIAAFLYERRSR